MSCRQERKIMGTNDTVRPRTITDEQTQQSLPLTGDLPNWLTGTYILNGPAQFDLGDQQVNHWFDGLGMLRRFTFSEGGVTYTNRMLRSNEFAYTEEHGELQHQQFGTNNRKTLSERLRSMFDTNPELTDNGVVSIGTVGKRFVAVTETSKMVEFDPESLTPMRTIKFDDNTDVLNTLAHSQYDPYRKTIVNLGNRIGRQDAYVLFERNADSTTRTKRGEIPTDRLAYVHSFGLTDQYAVIVESPLTFNKLSVVRDCPYIERFEWDDDLDTRFLVVDRQTGDRVAAPETSPFMTYHHANAFERDGELVVDLITFDDNWAVEALYLDTIRSPDEAFLNGELRRYRISLDATDTTIQGETIYPGPVAFPMINYEQYNTQPYQYLYAAGHSTQSAASFADQLVKVNLHNRTVQTWETADAYLGEPMFVPRPTGEREDDGVLLSVATYPDDEAAQLLILDAATLNERARATAPHSLPYGFHGQFYRELQPPTPPKSMT
jgi:beta,beta-carotene 9',10'-dioxygenase